MIIFKTLAGSRLYGYHRVNSDYDYRGVFIAPIEEIAGLAQRQDTRESIETDNNGETSDTVYYELRKFCKLALKGNPNILEILFAPVELWQTSSPDWIPFYAKRHAFLSQQLYHPYRGFMQSELHKLTSKYETKQAANAWRLATQCIQILTMGDFNPQLSEENAQFMRAIREDTIPQETVMQALVYMFNTELPNAFITTRLPEYPQSELISELCVTTYVDWIKAIS